MIKLLCKSQFREKVFRCFCGNVAHPQSTLVSYNDFSGSSSAGKVKSAAHMRLQVGRQCFGEKDTGSRICGGHRIPTSSKVFVLFLTLDLSAKEASNRRISLQGSIKRHFFMNFLQISLTESSSEECFHVGCCSPKSVPPIVCEVPHARSNLPQMKFSRRVRTLLHRK